MTIAEQFQLYPSSLFLSLGIFRPQNLVNRTDLSLTPVMWMLLLNCKTEPSECVHYDTPFLSVSLFKGCTYVNLYETLTGWEVFFGTPCPLPLVV